MLPSPALFGRALLVSILLHVLTIEIVMRFAPSLLRAPQPALRALEVRLREALPAAALLPPPPPPAARPAPRLLLPKESQANASAARPVLAAPPQSGRRDAERGPRLLAGEAARSALAQVARALHYPREAIEQGLEGQAVVMLFLDASGNVVAARLEASSGHAILDDAAVSAARTVRALPLSAPGALQDSAPREALLPVRFRLR
jgi:protein TonB